MSNDNDNDIGIDIEHNIDITKPLPNKTHELYAQHRASGKQKKDAYILARGRPDLKVGSIYNGVSIMERKVPEILDRIRYLMDNQASTPPETPVNPLHSQFNTAQDFITKYEQLIIDEQTNDGEVLKALSKLMELKNIQAELDHDRNKADPTKVLDVFIQAGLDGLSPADAVIKAFNGDYAAISRHLSDIFGCKVVLTPNVAVIPDDTAQVNDTQPID